MKTAKIGDKVKQKKIRKHQIDMVYTVLNVRKDGTEANIGSGMWVSVEDFKKYTG
jgi:hypothetical protein